MQISKAIVSRSSAIRSALEKYNKLAALQIPKRQHFKYKEVLSAVWLGEFELLCRSRLDILDKQWTIPANREVTVRFLKLSRAKEEVQRCEVEMRRLHEWMLKEEKDLCAVISSLQTTDPPLAAAAQAYYDERHRVNNLYRARIAAIQSLPKYCGPKFGVDTHRVEEVDGDNDETSEDLRDETLRLEECMHRVVA